MKKLLLTTIALAVATPAFAVNVYSNSDLNVDVYGRFGAAFDKSEETKADLKDDKSRIGLKATYDLQHGLTALGGVEFRFADEEGRFADPTTHDAYVGLGKTGVGTFTLGRQATTADEIRLSEYAYRRGDVTLLPTHGDRTIKFRSENYGDVNGSGTIGFGADYTFMGSASKDEQVKSRSVGGALFYAKNFGDIEFKLNGGYAQSTLNDVTIADTTTTQFSSGATRFNQKAFMIGSEVKYEDIALAVDYSHGTLRAKDVATGVKTNTLKTDAFQVAVKYAVTPEVNVFTAYQYRELKDTQPTSIKDSAHQFTVGADYKFHKNVVAYAQLDTIKVKDKLAKTSATDLGGAVGMRVTF